MYPQGPTHPQSKSFGGIKTTKTVPASEEVEQPKLSSAFHQPSKV